MTNGITTEQIMLFALIVNQATKWTVLPRKVTSHVMCAVVNTPLSLNIV